MTGVIQQCRLRGCPFLASTLIGHSNRTEYMCPTHANAFRCLTVPQQRQMLDDCVPKKLLQRTTPFVSALPAGFQ